MPFKLYLTAFSLLSILTASAQQKRQISADLNRSFAGTGDMKGLGFAIEYGQYIRKKIELTGALSSDLHHDEYKLLIVGGGTTPDASYRMVTGGVQFNGQLNYAPLRTQGSELRIGAGPVLRYQSSSASGGYGVYQPTGTGIPEPVFSFRQVEDQNILSAGYLVSLSYAYTFRSKLLIGAKASFQNDINADVILQYGVRIGRRL
jgi:hypothetical protein